MPALLKRLFAPLAIPGVLRVLAGFHALMFILMMILGPAQAANFLERLSLDFAMIFRGEVWRLASFILLPPANPTSSFGLLFLIFAVFFLFFINDILEDAWGADGLSAFFYTGFIGSMLAGLLIWLVEPRYTAALAWQLPANFATGFVMAAGAVAPKLTVRLFLVIPVPLWLIGAIGGAFLLLDVFVLFSASPPLAAVPLLGVANFLIWVLPGLLSSARRAQSARDRRSRFEKSRLPENAAFHTCEICGATDQSHPDREFCVTTTGQETCDACLAKIRGTDPAATP